MINKAITFVVGAGASHPYGLPLGKDLYRQARLVHEDWQVRALLTRCMGEENLRDLILDLRAHPAESIDAFLETRQDRREVMSRGKMLIAALMCRAIAKAGQPERHSETDWLGYIIEKMRKGCPTWADFRDGNKRVRFVTFNFDEFIEDRLHGAIQAIYRGSDVDRDKVRESFPVIHVHGALSTGLARNAWRLQYEWDVEQPLIDWVIEASGHINIALEQIPPQMSIQFQEPVLRCDALCFLGFAYDRVNLDKLGFTPRHVTSPKGIGMVCGSAYGMLDGERAPVYRYFDTITLAGETQDCREVLRDFDIFED
jgi:hypothetical protein